ncbi:MAG: GNAT family N-acetyltransferase [Oscillospiraceae bacterium]|jgi:predicted GNAT family acetyltransferase
MFKYEDGRIYMEDDSGKLIAEVTFPETEPGVVNFDHTLVEYSLRGRGIAGELMQAAADEVRRRGMKATATCSYAVKWFAEHNEYSDIIK